MRKNMKKRAALLLAAMMTVSVTACGGEKHQMLHLMQT